MFINKIKSNIYVETLGCLSLLFLRIGEPEIDVSMIFSLLTKQKSDINTQIQNLFFI